MARPQQDVHAAVWRILEGLEGLDPLKELFWSELNYERVNQPLSCRNWGKAATDALAEDPVLFASGGSDAAFHIVYARLASDKLLRTPERAVVSRLLRDHPYSLFVFSNADQDQWHFLNVKYGETAEKRRLYRRITVSPDERLRTASERIAMLDLEAVSEDLFGLSALQIQERHDEAFDVEAVTREFYDGYKDVFNILWKDLQKQSKDRHWAHDYALQFLNRCMFLYFVQRKRWLGNDTEFLATFWNAYTRSDQPKDTFFDRWLSTLFFEAFNDKYKTGMHKHLPEDIRDALAMAPYLNGGLFSENDLDRDHDPKVTDKRFKQVFDFLERYNFTIAEDSPLDQEVAVDPEMIGKVYESLVNVSEEATERGEAGIFYTPRTEIDLMCRLALVDNVANNLGDEHKNLFYETVFALEPQEQKEADAALAKAGLWEAVDDHLRQLTVVDPACGSGSFLVGMLHVLDDLEQRAAAYLDRPEGGYERRKRIIGRNLYGVDVMEWACRVAELRLWLALIIEADFTAAEVHQPSDHKPLLPNFSFKIRCGDSLVQEVGGIQLGHRRGSADIPKSIKDRLRKLQKAKLAFYSGDKDPKFKSEAAVRGEEVKIFRDLLGEQAKELEGRAKSLMRQQAGPTHTQIRLDGSKEQRSRQLELTQEQRERKIERLMSEAERLTAVRRSMRRPEDVPFVWDIAFAEVMESDDGGFDVVIGNPPYVRRENIADPHLAREKLTSENKKAYRAKLARSVYKAWPRFFRYKPSTDTPGRKMDAKSDLYVYFYFHGLSLLNQEGSFCFITSNSWLDVGYGKDLQEFLLRHGHARMVIDNEVKRSFASADVNTVIVLFAHPNDELENGSGRTARFVMFRVPFDQVLSPVLLEEIEEASDRKSTGEYRVLRRTQEMLLTDGSEPSGEEAEQKEPQEQGLHAHGPLIAASTYLGGKWGGKYLRAPEILWTVLDKGEGFLRPLGDFFRGERYLNTGGADGFFLLSQVSPSRKGYYHVHNQNTTSESGKAYSGEIEAKYLVPLIKNAAKDDKRIEVRSHDAYCLVVRGSPSKKLSAYIRWGERQGYHERSVTKNQKPWYKPTNQMLSAARVLVPRSFNDTFVIHFNPREYLSLRFYRLHVRRGDELRLLAYLNSTLITLFLESLGNKSLGQGVLDFFMADFLALRVPFVDVPELERVFSAIKDRRILPVWEEYGSSRTAGKNGHSISPLPDRAELDAVIFDALRLTKGERQAVYEAVLSLVEGRLKKARSLRSS